MDIIEQIKIDAKYLLEEAGCHDWDHVERVFNLAKTIGEKEGADMEVLLLATALHDIGRAEELKEVLTTVKANPRNFIAQPKMLLSVHSTFIEKEKQFEPRHIDLRTFSLFGKETEYILPGGLTRVALKKGLEKKRKSGWLFMAQAKQECRLLTHYPIASGSGRLRLSTIIRVCKEIILTDYVCIRLSS